MPVNYKEISTTGGRDIKEKYLTRIDAALRDLPVQQRAIIEAQIIEESGGDPMAKSANGTYQGLLQWGKDRYKIKSKDPYVELDNQIKYLRQSIGAITDGKSWTHGGKGSGYKSSKEAYGIFNNPEASFDDSFRAFSYGYVRPYGKEASYNNRLKVGHQVYDRILQSETEPAVYSDPLTALPDATLVVKPIVPIPTQEPIDLNLLHTKAEGGHLDTPTPWNELPISQRAEIMREAVSNGIYNLQDVRDAYHNNLFGGGGYMPSKAIKQRIAEWEGSSMYKAAPDTGKVNRSFEAEAKDFNRVIPASIRAKLSQDQLDALYSYGYNVGMGNLKERVLPTLTNYINGSAGAEDVASSMWASRDSDPKMGGLRRRRNYERSQFVYGSPAERRQSVVTSALNMDLSNLPSGPSEEDLQQLYLANPTDYGTPVDYSTPTRPVVESPVEEDYTQPSGMGIWGLMSSMGMFGDTTKQEAPLASYTPVKSSNPYVASIPTYNDTLLDVSWFGDGGPIDLGYNSKAYEEWKASLPKNLRKETPEYDLYGAYRAGLQPHLEADGYYHLGSRDPKTNRLLKKPSHPTYPLAILADAQEGYLAGPYDKKTDSVSTYPLPWIKGDGGYLYDDGGYTLTDRDSGNTYYGVDDVVSTDQLMVNPDGSVTTVNGVTGAVVLPEVSIKPTPRDKVKDYFTLSNDATALAGGRPQNLQLVENALAGAKAHAAWEKEHPNLAAWGKVAGAVPFAVASAPFAVGLGDMAAGTAIGNGITGGLTTMANAVQGSSWFPWLDAAATSYFGAHGLNEMVHGNVSPEAVLEVTPLTRFVKPTYNAAYNTAHTLYDNGTLFDRYTTIGGRLGNYSDNLFENMYATATRRFDLPDKARIPADAMRKMTFGKGNIVPVDEGMVTLTGGRLVGGKPHMNATTDRFVTSHKYSWDGKDGYIFPTQDILNQTLPSGSLKSIEPSDMFSNGVDVSMPVDKVTFVSGSVEALQKARAAGMQTLSSPKLRRMYENAWQKYYEDLARYKAKYGNTKRTTLEKVPNAPDSDGYFWSDYAKELNRLQATRGVPTLADYRLLEQQTGLNAGIMPLSEYENAREAVWGMRYKPTTGADGEVETYVYPTTGRQVPFTTDDMEIEINALSMPYNKVFYDPTSTVESNWRTMYNHPINTDVRLHPQ